MPVEVSAPLSAVSPLRRRCQPAAARRETHRCLARIDGHGLRWQLVTEHLVGGSDVSFRICREPDNALLNEVTTIGVARIPTQDIGPF